MLAGILACLDGYMNIAMEQTEVGLVDYAFLMHTRWSSANLYSLLQEYVNGQLKNKYGDAFIRGNNGVRCLPMTSPVRCTRVPAKATAFEMMYGCAVLYISTVKS